MEQKENTTNSTIQATPFNWEEIVIKNKLPVIVDFYASWCRPCMMMEHPLNNLAAKMTDIATIVKIDIDKYPFIANDYKIMSIPTIILFKDGKPVQKWQGMVAISALETAINNIQNTK